MQRLTLIGYRASGKSTVGRLVASRLNVPFVDADTAIVSELSMSIHQAITERGEPAFRDAEANVLRRILTASGPLILATGGGAVLRDSNRTLLQSHGGLVAYLHAPIAILQERLRRDVGGRPSLTGASVVDEVPALMAQREPLYRAAAAIVVDATLPVAQVADLLCTSMTWTTPHV